MITRRGLFLATGIGVAWAPLCGAAQPTRKVYRIGYLSAPSRESVGRALGWVEGQNLVIEYRWAEGSVERLPELATELARRDVDVIVAPGGSAALAAQNATSSIPIVMIFPSDPVELGLVASLSRPRGNITGTTFTPGPEIVGKQLQLLKETVPQASRVAILSNPAEPSLALQTREMEAAARALRIRLQHVEARGPQVFDGAFAAMARERAQALLVARGSAFLVHRTRLAELAVKGSLPTTRPGPQSQADRYFAASRSSRTAFRKRAASPPVTQR